MKLAIASDHAGFCQKDAMRSFLESLGHSVYDYGPEIEERVDYPHYAALVARAVSSGEVDKGVLICGTGLGMAIAANKIEGVRALPIQTPGFAQLAREHNNANVLCLSGRFVSEEMNKEIIKVFVETKFQEGRHAQRVAQIAELEGEAHHESCK